MSANDTASGLISRSEKLSYIECQKCDSQILTTTRTLGSQGSDQVSGAQVTLSSNYTVLTGTGQLETINTTGWAPGSIVIVMLQDGPQVANNTAATSPFATLLLDTGTVGTSAGSVFTFVYDGTAWREVSRMIV
jgi:hypothetical protein